MTRLRTVLAAALVAGLALVGVVAPVPAPAQAAAGPQQVLAAANVVGSLFQRNRVYRNAAEVQGEIRAYYDGLLTTARAALQDRELSQLDNQVAAYVRLVASLEHERDATLQLLEDDKRGARRVFRTELNRSLPTLLLAVPAVRDLAGVVRTDLGELRNGLQAMRTAVAEGRPAALTELAARRATVDRYAALAATIGGRPGRDLADAIGSLGERLERLSRVEATAAAEIDAGLVEADGHLATAIGRLDEQLATEVRPVSVSLFGGLYDVRIPGRYQLYAAVAEALSGTGSRTHGLTRDAMRDRVRQYLIDSRGARLAGLRDCFLANAAQLRAQLAGSAPAGSPASVLLETDLDTCDPEAVAAVLAAAAALDAPTTTSPVTPGGPADPGDEPAAGETWSVAWGDPTTAAAQQYLVSTDNVMTTNEGPVTYWHPAVGGESEADAPLGTLVYRIPIPGPIVGGELRMLIHTYHWDYSQGSAAIDGSLDGTTWEVLSSTGPPAFGEAASGSLDGPLPEMFLGTDEIWLRVRLTAWGPQAADGAPWTNTSQHGRSNAGADTGTFALTVQLAP